MPSSNSSAGPGIAYAQIHCVLEQVLWAETPVARQVSPCGRVTATRDLKAEAKIVNLAFSQRQAAIADQLRVRFAAQKIN